MSSIKLTFLSFIFLASLSVSHADTRLVKDQEYYSSLSSMLSTARRSVDIIAFSFAIDDGRGKIDQSNVAFHVAWQLVELKRNLGSSINIRLYLEGNRDTSERNRITANYLSSAGIVVQFGATHAKGFQVDGRTVLFGSTNLTSQSILRNNETNIISDSASINSEFAKFFNHLWNGGRHGTLTLNSPMMADGTYKNQLLKMINEARSTLEFAIYYFNDQDIERALIAAHRRGVQIIGYFNQHKSFALNLVQRNRETVMRLRAAGLPYLYFDLNTFFSHSKYIIKDRGEILLGTGNWNHSDVNEHRQLYVHLKDARLANELVTHLGQQIYYESDSTM